MTQVNARTNGSWFYRLVWGAGDSSMFPFITFGFRIQKGFPHFPLKIRCLSRRLQTFGFSLSFFFFNVANSHIPRMRNTIPPLSFIVDTNQQTSPYLQWERNHLILKAGTDKQSGTRWVPRTAILSLFSQQKRWEIWIVQFQTLEAWTCWITLTPNETERKEQTLAENGKPWLKQHHCHQTVSCNRKLN